MSGMLSGISVVGLGPLAPDQWGAGTNMPEGTINTYDDPYLPTFQRLLVKGADNGGTRILSIDATGVSVGDRKVFINLPTGAGGTGYGMVDSGSVLFVDENKPDVAGLTTATNRMQCPGANDVKCPIMGTVAMVYGADLRWHIEGDGGRMARATIQALHLWPNLQVGSAASPVSGNLNNWAPVGENPFAEDTGLDVSDLQFRQHTLIRLFVDNAGANLTGMVARTTAPGGLIPSDFGPLKVIMNYGPGVLTLKHLSGSSDVEYRIICPDSRDLKVPPYTSVWLTSPYLNNPDGISQWRVLGFGNEVFPSVNTVGAVTTTGLTLKPSNAPATLTKFTTPVQDLNCGSESHARVTAHADGSIIGGIVAKAVTGEVELKTITNIGGGPLIFTTEDAGSTAANRFECPGSVPYVLEPRCSVDLLWDGSNKWKLKTNQNDNQLRSITPAAFGTGNVDSWDPTDATSGLSFKYIRWIRAQGAVGTNLRSMKAPSGHGDRFMISNYASGMTIKHAAGAADKNFYCPGGVDYVLAAFASVWITYDAGNNVYLVG